MTGTSAEDAAKWSLWRNSRYISVPFTTIGPENLAKQVEEELGAKAQREILIKALVATAAHIQTESVKHITARYAISTSDLLAKMDMETNIKMGTDGEIGMYAVFEGSRLPVEKFFPWSPKAPRNKKYSVITEVLRGSPSVYGNNVFVPQTSVERWKKPFRRQHDSDDAGRHRNEDGSFSYLKRHKILADEWVDEPPMHNGKILRATHKLTTISAIGIPQMIAAHGVKENIQKAIREILAKEYEAAWNERRRKE